MASSYKHGEEESTERSKEGNVVWMLAQHLLCNLDHPVHTACSLQHTGAGYGCNDDVDNISGWGTWLQVEAENENCQADAGNCTKGKAAVT